MQFNCPTANTMPVTLNLGFQMPSWFDIKSLEVGGSEDETGIKEAATAVHGMINNEIRSGIPANRIILGGFSQGGALALYSALTYPEKLAGVIGLSCWLPLHNTFPAAKVCPDSTPGNSQHKLMQMHRLIGYLFICAVLLCHGDSDPIVSYKFGQLSHSMLKSFLKTTELKT
jgi:lysophospholipase II